MSHLKKKIVKTMVVLALITGSVMAINSTSFDAKAATQTIETQSEVLAGAIGQKVDPVRKGWQRFDAPSKVKNAQDKTRPIGQKIQNSVSGKTVPGVNAALWGERHMSLPAMLLVLIFGGVFLLMGMSGPTSRLGGRH